MLGLCGLSLVVLLVGLSQWATQYRPLLPLEYLGIAALLLLAALGAYLAFRRDRPG